MVGAQVGLTSQFLIRPKTWVDFEIKGGIFQNNIVVDRAYQLTDFSDTILAESDGRDEVNRTSWMGDLSLVFNHHFGRYFTIRAGYNAIFVNDLALASRNMGTNIDILEFGPVLAHHDGDVVYHGPLLGLVFAR